ncbi:BTAD domain-containing putative transcriptional regulator [Actinoplanes sp. GCM10030250]|uniref:AfsR/SARP family transcriptional regulator n=1 Tax=Actinoplanes sp. GCM10030250 TaxID=3273376 RepID=UPI003612951C
MEIRLLGPIEIINDGRALDAGAPQQRLVLTALAADAGRLIGTESLIDRVWDVAPSGARRTLQVHLSRLRRLLDTAQTEGQAPVQVLRRSGGYLLDVDPEQVDALRFRLLVERAHERQRTDQESMKLLAEAMDLRRGPPLADLPGQWAATVRQAWDQQYVDAVQEWAATSVRVGEVGPVLALLAGLTAERPTAESLAAAYIRTLYAAGRPADALDHYAGIRQHLAEKLGADPGPELQQLYRQILAADPALAQPATLAQPAVEAHTGWTPRQLPAPPPAFTGRADELALLDRPGDTDDLVITVIDGMAGVGKTALAIEAAHRIAGRYPDGQLHLDLRGYTEGAEPMEPAEALDHLLRGIGVPEPQIPAGTDGRAALYRTRLAGRRVLIVLDNAAGESQVAPLLPGAPGCLVLVTSRHQLAGLDNTRQLSLDTLAVSDAVTLFVRSAGVDLRGHDPALLAELAELCGRLPLAIRIAASRLRSHPTWSPAHLAERLRDQRYRLAELEAGQRSVTASLDLSYQRLNPEQQHAYQVLGRHPGPDIDEHATATLLDATPVSATQILNQLLDMNLLREPAAGRYQFHDLTRAHAAYTAARDEP